MSMKRVLDTYASNKNPFNNFATTLPLSSFVLITTIVAAIDICSTQKNYFLPFSIFVTILLFCKRKKCEKATPAALIHLEKIST